MINRYTLTGVSDIRFTIGRVYSVDQKTWETIKALRGKRIAYTVSNMIYVFTVAEAYIADNSIVAVPEDNSVKLVDMLMDNWQELIK